MDPRIREHAGVIADHSTGIEAGDMVVVSAPPEAEDLVVALFEVIGDRNATPAYMGKSERADRAFMRAADAEELETPAHTKALYEELDVLIRVRAPRNATETSDVDPAATAARQRVGQPVQEVALSKRWCLTQFPTAASAQLAEMSSEAYEQFVWDAVNLDWEAQYEFQENMVEPLDDAAEVRIVSGENTDVSMSIDGMVAVNDDARHNLPGGEVFTAPVPGSVEGEVYFDKPVYRQGREVTDARLVFEDGEVIEHGAGKNEAVLTEILETDAGARRLGELGIGMNRAIDRFTYNMLFDEKMGDTVHMAVGNAYDETVGEDREGNDSAAHVDMIVDMTTDSRIELDGEVVQRNGTFAFEEGFEE
jgi:aminopeptidase